MPTIRERVTAAWTAFTIPRALDTFAGIEATISDIGRRALLPEWYFAAPFGQPRGVNIMRVRELAETTFVNMCVTTIVDEFAAVPWDIVPKDGVDLSDKVQSQIDEVKEFLMKPNHNKETLSDLKRQWGRDVLVVDAGVLVKVFDDKSYEGEYLKPEKKYAKEEKKIKVSKNVYYKDGPKEGRFKKKEVMEKSFHPLKELGSRTLIELYCRDGSTFLADGDYTGFVHRYYQYVFKIPRREPTIFDRDEIVYSMKNPRSYSFYGWSAVQSLEDIVQTLKSWVLHHEGSFKEKGQPPGIVSILDISKVELERLREYWKKEIKGKPHKLAIIGRDAKFTSTQVTGRDMEMLATMQWFMKYVMAMYNLNIPILSLSGQAPKAGTEALIQREKTKAILPLMQLFQHEMNAEVLPEFGYEDIEFKFLAYDLEEDERKRKMQIADVDSGILTINEVRTEDRGKDPVPWGDEPMKGGGSPFGQPPPLPFQEFQRSIKKEVK